MDDQERRWRDEFPIAADLVYLNNCSLTPLPRRGKTRIERFLREWTELGGRAWYDHWIGEYEALREDLAGVLGADRDEVAIEPNVSAALVGIASTFDYTKRPKVIVSDLDFPTDGHAFLAVTPRGAQVQFVRSPDHVRMPLEVFERAIDERTAAVCTGHVYFTTGWIQDVKALAEICHRKGARLFEYGTPAVAAIYAARAGIELLREVGVETVRLRHMALSQRLVDGAVAQSWTVRCPTNARERTAIVTLEHPEPQRAVDTLRAAGVITDSRPGLIRLSPHYFNTADEMDRALELLA